MARISGMHDELFRSAGTERYRFLRPLTSIASLSASDRLVFEATTTTEPLIRVAIKLYLSNRPFSEQRIKRAATRARAAYQVASVLDHFAFPRMRELMDGVFVVMDWVNGRRLSEILKEQRLPKLEALSIGLQIANACAALSKVLTHNYPDTPDMGHGDLHFDNVLIENGHDAPTVRLVDFDHIGRRLPGIADWDTDLISQARRAGAQIVQAPEHVLGSVTYLDSRADVFSLGAILYRLISGKSAFREPGSYLKRLRRLFDGQLRPDEDVCLFVHDDIEDAELRQLLTNMLRFDRVIRIGPMDKVVGALSQIAH